MDSYWKFNSAKDISLKIFNAYVIRIGGRGEMRVIVIETNNERTAYKSNKCYK